MVFLQSSGDADSRGLPVAEGVQDEFADDAENGVRRVVRKPGARDVEADGDPGVLDVGLERHANRLVHVRLLKRIVTQVPETVAQFAAAGLEGLPCQGEMRIRLLRPLVQLRARGLDLE